MKAKIFATIMVTMFLVVAMFSVFPVKAQFVGDITIGVIGPTNYPHWTAGYQPASEMARDEINDAGGVYLSAGPNGAGNYQIVLEFGHEEAGPPPDPDDAAAVTEDLILNKGVDFIIGGFRTECVEAEIEVAMDWDIPFYINGASTTELISDTVAVDYARYKYLFRVNPMNSTVLPTAVLGFLQWLIPIKFLPLYGHDLGKGYPQVRVAVITEDLEWADLIHTILTNPAYYPTYLGPYANVTYDGRIPEEALGYPTGLNPWLQDVDDSDARICIHIFSGVIGPTFTGTWKARVAGGGSNWVPVGINVYGQMQAYWTLTGGACEYEAFLDSSGTRTPIIPGVTEVFWDNFVAKTGGAWPLYTGFGAYDGIMGLCESLEAIGSLNIDALVAHNEDPAYQRWGLTGLFKYTSLHDMYSPPEANGPYAHPEDLVRSLVVQWQESGSGAKQVVSPIDKPYSRRFKIPPWMYPYDTDLDYNGNVNIFDVAIAAAAFGSMPGHPRWDKEADCALPYGIVNIFDVAKVASEFGSFIPIPLP